MIVFQVGPSAGTLGHHQDQAQADNGLLITDKQKITITWLLGWARLGPLSDIDIDMKYDWQLKLCVGSDLVTPLGCGTVWQRRHRVHQRCEELRTCTIGISSVRYQHQQTVLLSTALHSDHAVTCPLEDHDSLSTAPPRCVAPVAAYLRWLGRTSSSLGVISCSEDCLRARLAGRGGPRCWMIKPVWGGWCGSSSGGRPAALLSIVYWHSAELVTSGQRGAGGVTWMSGSPPPPSRDGNLPVPSPPFPSSAVFLSLTCLLGILSTQYFEPSCHSRTSRRHKSLIAAFTSE